MEVTHVACLPLSPVYAESPSRADPETRRSRAASTSLIVPAQAKSTRASAGVRATCRDFAASRRAAASVASHTAWAASQGRTGRPVIAACRVPRPSAVSRPASRRVSHPVRRAVTLSTPSRCARASGRAIRTGPAVIRNIPVETARLRANRCEVSVLSNRTALTNVISCGGSTVGGRRVATRRATVVGIFETLKSLANQASNHARGR